MNELLSFSNYKFICVGSVHERVLKFHHVSKNVCPLIWNAFNMLSCAFVGWMVSNPYRSVLLTTASYT